MGSGNKAHNHGFLIAQAQKIGLLKVAVSDEDACNRYDKPSNLPPLIHSTYYHYFYTLVIPSQELTFPWKQVA